MTRLGIEGCEAVWWGVCVLRQEPAVEIGRLARCETGGEVEPADAP